MAIVKTINLAPYFKEYGKRPGIVTFVVMAAAMGAITGAVVVIGDRSIADTPVALLGLARIGLLRRFNKLEEPIIVSAAAAIGLVLALLHH